MMPTVVPIESSAQRNSAHSMTNSNRSSVDDARVTLAADGHCSRASSCSRVMPTCDPPAPNAVPVLRSAKCFCDELVDLRRQRDVADFAHQRPAARSTTSTNFCTSGRSAAFRAT